MLLNTSLKMQQGSFYIAVWGCQMNVYDADRIADLLSAMGYVRSEGPKGAQIIVLVTCAVRAKAEDKVFNQIAAWQHDGVINDNTILCLGGCIGSELGQKLIEFNSRLNIVFGPRTAHKLPSLINAYKENHRAIIDTEADSLEKFDRLPESGRRGPSAFVTIMEGCSNKCSYCIVPYTRGEEESRPMQDILDEILIHLENGAKEIHLLGQNVNSYRGPSASGETHFSTLLYEIAALGGVERLRFTTSNPMDFSDDIVKAIGEIEIIANAVHVPIQSGSNRILQLMRRRYTQDDYLRLVDKLINVREDIAISSDFIVGFPGESDEDFKQTLEVVDKVKFDQSFSFVYSKRPGTPAALMEDKVPLEVKKERLYKLQAKLEEYATLHTNKMLGTTQQVLVEGISRKDQSELKSRASNNRIVVFKGSPNLIGQMAEVKIESLSAHTLRGKLI